MVMITTGKQAFPLGMLVATPGALKALEEGGETAHPYVAKHASGDWGVVCTDDAKANDEALASGARLLSAYRLKNGTKIWIITEAADDAGTRAVTTILLPDEY